MFRSSFVFVLFLFVYTASIAYGQPKSDIELIKDENFHNPAYNKRKIEFGITRGDNFLLKYNPVSLFLGGTMYTYQRVISPQMDRSCLFHPSCSRYSQLLIKEYGILKGLFTTSDRLTRCHRISATTFNPIRQDPVDHKIHENVDYYKLHQ